MPHVSSADALADLLPGLRRFSRALSGDQSTGDHYVGLTLEAILADRTLLNVNPSQRVALYRVFCTLWAGVRATSETVTAEQSTPDAVAARRLKALAPESRMAVLLTAMEDFAPADAAVVMARDLDEFDALQRAGYEQLRKQTAARVLIIEDEPIISMDLQEIVLGLGHDVVATADTRDTAVAAALEHRPSLVLADIQLADGSSGIDAVTEILRAFETPVIFITAYPERLLTGDRPEPTFLLTKPFKAEAVEATIAQAVFFDTGAPLAVA